MLLGHLLLMRLPKLLMGLDSSSAIDQETGISSFNVCAEVMCVHGGNVCARR